MSFVYIKILFSFNVTILYYIIFELEILIIISYLFYNKLLQFFTIKLVNINIDHIKSCDVYSTNNILKLFI
jgi:hypothetical protein